MGRQFDHQAEDFTLEKIIEWGFDQYHEKIKEISESATKELMIETGLSEIEQMWETQEFDMITYKDKGHYKLRSADDVTLKMQCTFNMWYRGWITHGHEEL